MKTILEEGNQTENSLQFITWLKVQESDKTPRGKREGETDIDIIAP